MATYDTRSDMTISSSRSHSVLFSSQCNVWTMCITVPLHYSPITPTPVHQSRCTHFTTSLCHSTLSSLQCTTQTTLLTLHFHQLTSTLHVTHSLTYRISFHPLPVSTQCSPINNIIYSSIHSLLSFSHSACAGMRRGSARQESLSAPAHSQCFY